MRIRRRIRSDEGVGVVESCECLRTRPERINGAGGEAETQITGNRLWAEAAKPVHDLREAYTTALINGDVMNNDLEQHTPSLTLRDFLRELEISR